MTPEQILTIHERLDEVMEHISVHDVTGDWDVASGNNMYDALVHLRDALPQRPETGWMVRNRYGQVCSTHASEHDAWEEADKMQVLSPNGVFTVSHGIETDEGWKEKP
jgi:hypothetical protein